MISKLPTQLDMPEQKANKMLSSRENDNVLGNFKQCTLDLQYNNTPTFKC